MSYRICAARQPDGAGAPGGPPKAEPGAGSAGRSAADVALIISKWAGHHDSAFTQKTHVEASDEDLQHSQSALARTADPWEYDRAPSYDGEQGPDLRVRSALGGTRTPNLLIRRDLQAHPLPAHTSVDLPKCCSTMRNNCQRYAAYSAKIRPAQPMAGPTQ
jgi:hypothetical protein